MNRLWLVSTLRCTSEQTNFRWALRISTPGSRPASAAIWKPLQIASTGTPCAGAALDLGHHRRLRRHGAAAQVVAVGEAARHHDQVGLREVAVAVPDHLRLAAGDQLDRLRDVAFAIGAGEDQDRRLHQPTSSIE